MGRPSLKKERTAEILDGFMRTVARYGLDGSTQDRIAEEAGVNRTILRHYIGNRDDMIAALSDHVGAKFDAMTQAMIASLPPTGRSGHLIALLFGGRHHASVNAAAYQALVAAADRYPRIEARLTAFLETFEAALAAEFARDHPEAEAEDCRIVAAGVAAIYFSLDATLPLNPSSQWRARHRAAAERLLKTLG